MHKEIGYDFWLKQIGLNVSFYRNLIGEKQDAFDERVGISRTYLSSIEAPNMVTPPPRCKPFTTLPARWRSTRLSCSKCES